MSWGFGIFNESGFDGEALGVFLGRVFRRARRRRREKTDVKNQNGTVMAT